MYDHVAAYRYGSIRGRDRMTCVIVTSIQPLLSTDGHDWVDWRLLVAIARV